MPKKQQNKKAPAEVGKNGKTLVGWAFLIGVLLAIIIGLGLLQSSPFWLGVLIIIGLIVGLLNIGQKEVSPFLMSGAVLIIASALGQVSMSAIPTVNNILDALLAIFVPATIIVAIKNVFVMARD